MVPRHCPVWRAGVAVARVAVANATVTVTATAAAAPKPMAKPAIELATACADAERVERGSLQGRVTVTGGDMKQQVRGWRPSQVK